MWSEALDQFERHLRQTGMTPATVTAYVGDVRHFASWLSERFPYKASPASFSSQDVQEYLRYEKEVMDRAPASINRRLQSIRAFGRFALETGLRDTDPNSGVRSLATPAPAAPRILQRQEENQLLRAARKSDALNAARDLALTQLLLGTGMRARELVRLRLSDVRWHEDGGHLLLKQRDGKPDRAIPLDDKTALTLRAYMDEMDEAGLEEDAFLFPGREGKPLSVRAVQQIVTSLGKQANLEISPKVLRDTYATRLWKRTSDIELLAERMGHKGVQALMRYILALVDSDNDAGEAESD